MKTSIEIAIRILRSLGTLVLLSTSVLLVGCSPARTHSTPGYSPDRATPIARIAFVQNDSISVLDTVKWIYVMNADGSGQMNISRDVQAWDIAWSPDGSRFAFTCPLDNNLEICTIDADGSHPSRLTNSTADDQNPTWSPDGQQIAFASNRDGHFQIYAMRANGSELVQLTHTSANELQPAWSPDGQHITFTSNRVNRSSVRANRDIFIMDSNGEAQTNLTRNTSACVNEFPSWSPDSSQIAFDSNCQGPWFQVYVMRADGTGLRRLTNSEGNDRHPNWSPDALQIAFDSNRALADPGRRLLKEESEIYIVSVNNGTEKQLTPRGSEFCSHPAWVWSLGSVGPAQ